MNWVDCGLPFDYDTTAEIKRDGLTTAAWAELIDARKAEDKPKSFSGTVGLKAGMLVEVKSAHGGAIEQMLVGTINDDNGTCGCCGNIHPDDVVLRYCIIWEKK